jgi:hypothetical protein
MEPLIWMGAGAAGLGAVIVAHLGMKHGWAWVQSRLKAHADAAAADFKAKIDAASGDVASRLTVLETHVHADVAADIAQIKADIAGLKKGAA